MKNTLLIIGAVAMLALTAFGLHSVKLEAPVVPEGNAEMCVCTMQYDPVCGVDGKTYGNACGAACAKVAIKSLGECSAPESLPKPKPTPVIAPKPVGACALTLKQVCFAGPIAEDEVITECGDGTLVYKNAKGEVYHGTLNRCR